MIHFNSEDIPIPNIDQKKTIDWALQVASLHRKKVGEINYIFCSDTRILEINQQYLQHDYYTDIITFDYSEQDNISGDIYIGIETVASNAMQLGFPFETELSRVIIHGILHLCGFKDKTPGTEKKMHEKEDEALKLLF
jgi:metalloprotein, YbeY/UPF0054 family